MMVLFCGGYADGRWIALPEDTKEYEIAARGDFNWKGPEKVEVKTQRYRIWPITILGWSMWVAALAERNYENNDVLRALTQRDVFKHLVGGDRVTR